ncbi:MAG: WbqC family protein [Bacteroidota bacterium]
MDRTLLIEPHYLGSLEYFVLISQFDAIQWEVREHFVKQTYRNRAVVLTANGPQNLIVPVKYSRQTALIDVKIEYAERWVKDHWGAIYSAYGKAPFFEHFGPYFQRVFANRPTFLWELCHEMMTLCLKCLQIDRSITLTQSYEKEDHEGLYDYRNLIHPKKAFGERSVYKSYPYFQIFGKEFVPNLSVLDLLLSLGNESSTILEKSSI